MENVRRISSFSVDHDLIDVGIYVSRIDGDITTYDLRTRKPNMGDYMDNLTMHSVEHMVATYIRNSEIGADVIYFGPMGCRTGFYLLVRDIEPKDVITLVRDAFTFLRDFEGDIPGVSAIECGNYLEHDLDDAKREAKEYIPVLDGYTVEMLKY